MQKILPHLWFDKEAGEAARFYTSVFPDSAVGYVSMIPSTPSGDTEIVAFRLAGCEFMAISAGPVFKFNPSISFLVACRDGAEVEATVVGQGKDGKIVVFKKKRRKDYSVKRGHRQDYTEIVVNDIRLSR